MKIERGGNAGLNIFHHCTVMLNRNVKSKASTAPTPLLETTDGGSASAPKPTYFAPLSSGPTRKKKSLFAGLVAKPDSKAELSTTTNTGAESKDIKAVGKRKLDKDDEEEEGLETKKVKASTTSTASGSGHGAVAVAGAGAGAKPNGLVGLVAYDSSSDEDED